LWCGYFKRVIQASWDGSFALPNLSASQARIRARATCVRDGQTVSGQTVFSAIANGVVSVPEFFTGDADPVPVSIAPDATIIEFSDLGETQQLTIQVAYSDSNVIDVTM